MSNNGRWEREPNEFGRIGRWNYMLAGERWQLEQRSGDDDFGWYLYGPDGSPFGLSLHRRLGPAKRLAEDYVHDVPGCRNALAGADYDHESTPGRSMKDN